VNIRECVNFAREPTTRRLNERFRHLYIYKPFST